MTMIYGDIQRDFLMNSFIDDTPVAPSNAARQHFAEKLGFETDCWTVHEGLKALDPGFVVIDVRGPAEYSRGHVPGAINIPYARMPASLLRHYPKGTTFVVYGAGPHCQRPDKAAILLADLNLPVKIMIGGFSGWREEGYRLESEAEDSDEL